MEIDGKLGSGGMAGGALRRDSRPAGRRLFLFGQGLNVAALASCNAVLAVLSAWYVVARTGLNVETDAFFASGALPQLAFLLLSATLPPVLVPLLATKDEESQREDAWLFFLLTAGLFGLLGAGLYLTCGLWVPLLVPGFSAE